MWVIDFFLSLTNNCVFNEEKKSKLDFSCLVTATNKKLHKIITKEKVIHPQWLNSHMVFWFALETLHYWDCNWGIIERGWRFISSYCWFVYPKTWPLSTIRFFTLNHKLFLLSIKKNKVINKYPLIHFYFQWFVCVFFYMLYFYKN